jgi:hypothetical protein
LFSVVSLPRTSLPSVFASHLSHYIALCTLLHFFFVFGLVSISKVIDLLWQSLVYLYSVLSRS